MRQKTTPKRTRRDVFRPEPPLRATELDRLKELLLQELLAQTADRPELNPAYRRAANDALSLAWVTPFPLLFLPDLLEEKAAEARQRTEKQEQVRQRTAKWKAVA